MLNFKGWNKIAEDKDTTTVQHEKGHVMKIVHKGLPKIQKEALKRLKLAEGTPEGTVGDKPQAPVTVNVGTQQPAMSQPVQAPVAPVKVPEIPLTPNTTIPNGSMNAPAVAQAGQKAAQLGAQIGAAQSQAMVQPSQQTLQRIEQLNQDRVNNINELKQHADQLAASTGLKENAYLENMGAGRKMGTAIGLMLGGAGAGVTGGPNIAYDFLNKQIDRNIEAQKERFGQQKTVWSAYYDLYGREEIANNMARVDALQRLEAQARVTAAQLGTPMAYQKLLEAQSRITPEINKLILESAGSIGPQSLPGNNPQKPEQQQVLPSGPHGEDISSFVSPKGGMPGANASVSSGKEKLNKYYESHILEPNANEILHSRVQQGGKFSREDYGKVQDQLSNAAQAEKAMEKIDEIFPQLEATTNFPGAISSSVNPHAMAAALGAVGGGLGGLASMGAIPVTGGLSTMGAPALISGGAAGGAAAGEGLGHLIQGAGVLGGNKEKQHQALKSELMGIIMGAYPNATQSEVNTLLESKTPNYLDDKETYKIKLKAIKDFIKTKTKTDLLEHYGAVKKK